IAAVAAMPAVAQHHPGDMRGAIGPIPHEAAVAPHFSAPATLHLPRFSAPAAPHFFAPAAPPFSAPVQPQVSAPIPPHFSAPQVVPLIAAPQGPHSVPQTVTPHVTPDVTPQMATPQITRPAPQQFAPSSGPAVRYVPPRNLATPVQPGSRDLARPLRERDAAAVYARALRNPLIANSLA